MTVTASCCMNVVCTVHIIIIIDHLNLNLRSKTNHTSYTTAPCIMNASCMLHIHVMVLFTSAFTFTLSYTLPTHMIHDTCCILHVARCTMHTTHNNNTQHTTHTHKTQKQNANASANANAMSNEHDHHHHHDL